MAEIGPLTLDCPVCGHDLPPVGIVASTWTIDSESKQLVVGLLPDLSDKWWEEVRGVHPDCIGP